jgi:hypothetical protein
MVHLPLSALLSMVSTRAQLATLVVLLLCVTGHADPDVAMSLAAGTKANNGNGDCLPVVVSSTQPLTSTPVASPANAEVYGYGDATTMRGLAAVTKQPAVVQTVGGTTVTSNVYACAGGYVTVTDELQASPGNTIRIFMSIEGTQTTGKEGGQTAEGIISTSIDNITGTNVWNHSYVFTGLYGVYSIQTYEDTYVLPSVSNLSLSSTLSFGAVIRSDAQASTSSAAFQNSAHVYFDSLSPDQDLTWASGLSHSDPDFKRQAPIQQTHPGPASTSPTESIRASGDDKILGGGADVGSASTDYFLVYSAPFLPAQERPPGFINIPRQPSGTNVVWSGAGASSGGTGVSSIDVRAIRFPDPSRLYAIIVEQGKAHVAGKPSRILATASLPPDYVMVSGGCQITAVGVTRTARTPPGQQYPAFLTGSYPDETTQRSWICEAELDANARLPTAAMNALWTNPLTAYVVGIKPTVSAMLQPIMRITKTTAAPGTKPTATSDLFADGFLITGGGGQAVPQKQITGKMYLTGMLPVTSSSVANAPANQWQANANGGTSPGTVTSYAINVLFKPPRLTCTNLSSAAPGATITINGQDFVRNMKVRFGATDVPATISTVLQATATVPTGLSAGTTQISVVVGDVATSSCPFTVLP